MARQTFQARLRTYGGRALSQVDARDGVPRQLLAQNLAGPIQIVLPADPADDDYEVGFLPAYFAIEKIQVITPAGAGTIAIDLPAYSGLSSQNLVAALGNAADSAVELTLVPDRFSSYAKDRPLVVSTVGVTGQLRVGIFGFPLDDAGAQGG